MRVPSRHRRRGPRRALSEDQILDAAFALMDEGGAAAASVRGIAARVGVTSNAVSTYFPDKAAVVAALVERLLGEVAAAGGGLGSGKVDVEGRGRVQAALATTPSQEARHGLVLPPVIPVTAVRGDTHRSGRGRGRRP